MKIIKILVLLGLLASMIISCGQPSPEGPSYKSTNASRVISP